MTTAPPAPPATDKQVNFQSASFLTSVPSLDLCPPEKGLEVAFAGRSNAGKSSAINVLTGNNKLARTSKTPGRTQQLNFFTLGNELQRIVDLPGYGYAKVPLAMKNKWEQHLSKYLQERETLSGLILLMDIRRPFQDFDTMMLNWGVSAEMPVHILLTKSDKLNKGPAQSTLKKVTKHLVEANVDDLVSVQTFSSLKKSGVPELKTVLTRWLTLDDSISQEPESKID